MNQLNSLMPWLPEPPAEFRAIIRDLAKGSPLDGGTLRRIAATAMDITQLGRLGKLVADRHAEIARDGGFLPLRLGLVGSHTLDFVADALCATGLRHGLLLSLVRAPYGQVTQAVLDPDSELAPGKVDAVLLALDARALGIHRPQFTSEASAEAIDAAVSQMTSLRNGVHERLGASVVFQTLPLPADPLFGGSFDARMQGSPALHG